MLLPPPAVDVPLIVAQSKCPKVPATSTQRKVLLLPLYDLKSEDKEALINGSAPKESEDPFTLSSSPTSIRSESPSQFRG